MGHRDENSAICKLQEATSAHHEILCQLQAQADGGSNEDLIMRLETLEYRIDCNEHGSPEQQLSEKADRSELLRLDAELRELAEPLRRLSHRVGTSEVRTASLERRYEQLQELLDAP